MKNILILTDFSDNSWNALFTALKLFEDKEVRFFLMNCYEPAFAPVLGHKSKERMAVIYDSLSRNSAMRLAEMDEYLQKHHRNEFHQFTSLSIEGEIVDGIKEFYCKEELDLIVMGTKGATGAREVFMGSNTVKVIKKINKYPILAVPSGHDFKTLRNIVFPTDFNQPYGRTQLKPLIELAQMWSSKVTIFQVTQGSELNRRQLENKGVLETLFSNLLFEYQAATWNLNIKDAVLTEVETTNADMIALIYYTHTFLERLTREPVIKKMAFHSSVPLLVLPETTAN